MIKLPPVIAHRGASAQAPENTFAAFKRAAEQGATWIECDVQCTLDGIPVIIHDDTLDRTTNGSGVVSAQNWPALQQLDAGSWFDPQYTNEPLPLLTNLLPWLKQHGIGLNLEIKATTNHEATLRTADICAPIIANCINTQDILVSSFNTNALAIMQKLAPHVPRGLLVDIDNPHTWLTHRAHIQANYKRLDCISLHLNQLACIEQVIYEANFAHQIATYTVNNPERAQTLYRMGVNAIFSNYGAA